MKYFLEYLMSEMRFRVTYVDNEYVWVRFGTSGEIKMSFENYRVIGFNVSQ